MRKQQAGFSLVELVTVLSVMSILAVMASGSFAQYSSKTQAAEALKITDGLKNAFVTRYVEDARVPPTALPDIYGTGPGSLLTDHSGKAVASVNLDGGVYVVTYGIDADPALAGDVLTFTPYETRGGGIVWQCGTGGIPVDGLAAPLSVAGTIAGTPIVGTLQATTLDAEFLPRDCR